MEHFAEFISKRMLETLKYIRTTKIQYIKILAANFQ